MMVDDAITNILGEVRDEEYILARDAKHAHSMRVSFFNKRRKLPRPWQDVITATLERVNDQIFVKIYRRTPWEGSHWEKNKQGELTPVNIPNPDEKRMTELIKLAALEPLTDEEEVDEDE